MTASERQTAARAALHQINQARQRTGAQIAELERQVAPAADDVGTVQQLRSERQGVLAQLLRRGQPPVTAAPDIARLSDKIADAAARAETSQEMLAAAAEIRAELEGKLSDFARQEQEQQRELAIAGFYAMTEQIEGEALPEFLAALEAMATAYGRLAGAGIAHTRMAATLRERFDFNPGQALGSATPARRVEFALPGFGMEERLRAHPTVRGHNFNNVLIDCDAEIAAAADGAMAQWLAS